MKRKIITVCGSSRFIEHFAVYQWSLEKNGAIALGLHLLPKSYTDIADHLAEAEGVAEHFNALHLDKIEMSDEVHVLNVDGYIGDDTKREIEFAKKLGKPIIYLEPIS